MHIKMKGILKQEKNVSEAKLPDPCILDFQWRLISLNHIQISYIENNSTQHYCCYARDM